MNACADVFSVLLRTRWATSHLQRLLLLLHKAVRQQPAPRQLTKATSRAVHRLRVTSETLAVRLQPDFAPTCLCRDAVVLLKSHAHTGALYLQVAEHTASQFEAHLYMGILQPACTMFREKLSTDMDVRQCALSFVDHGANCALECMQASDAQLQIAIAGLLKRCHHASSATAELLLHEAVDDLDRCQAASFAQVAGRVMDEEVWQQLQESFGDLQVSLNFVKERLSTVGKGWGFTQFR
jgi:hypothetical protein